MQGVAKYYKDKIAHQKGSDIKRKEGLLRTKRGLNRLTNTQPHQVWVFCFRFVLLLLFYLSILCACVCVYVCRAITVNLNIVVEDTFSKLTSLEIALKRAKEKKNQEKKTKKKLRALALHKNWPAIPVYQKREFLCRSEVCGYIFNSYIPITFTVYCCVFIGEHSTGRHFYLPCVVLARDFCKIGAPLFRMLSCCSFSTICYGL